MHLQNGKFATFQELIDGPFWLMEEKIKRANKMIEDRENNRKKEEKEQKTQMPNMNPNSMMGNMNSMMNKFKK